MDLALKDKIIVVTGGTAGIGKAIAAAFLKEGARVAIFGTNTERGESAVQELGDSCRFFKVDVSKTEEVSAAIKEVVVQLGPIDVLVNNAGITQDQLLIKMSEEDWDRVIEVNLKSCYTLCRSMVRDMMKARRGKIINISSIVGIMGNPGQTNYAASKAGMIGFTKALAKEIASRNIQVNCVAPGFIQTAMTDKLKDEQKQAILQTVPLNRFGTVDEIADLVLFLASERSNYITGQVISIDGGMH